MQATRILPDLQCSLLCEEVRQEVNGSFFLVGILGVIHVTKIPITAFKLLSFTRWTAGIGNFLESVRLVAPDQTTVVRQSQVKFSLQDPAHHATNVTVFPQVEFKAQGIYSVEVLVDDVMKLRYPLPVVLVQQPPQGAQPPAETPVQPEAPGPGAS